MPDSLALPDGETACWELHLENLKTSQELCAALQRRPARDSTPEGNAYLNELSALDREAAVWAASIVDGLNGR
jgi:hypothetical protein